ncbi:hypothetical protein Zmor_015987 [Zophobas morio]|uniref:DED domain-containing protein n=1 Tax=Zophobas morio TaxID=2755281 RepID=A0AA38IKT5_9CUCU|nr:hypothetical protein Zmor_015987 [Zophobas morio]
MGAMLSNENNDDYLQDSSYSEDEENSTNEAPHRRISPIYDKIDLTNNICLDSPTDTTDAAPPTATMATTLTVDQVMVVEDHLDIFEKVSLVYLLYDNPAVALKLLTKLVNGSNDKLIHNWTIFQNIKKSKWQEELEEALYIIQNYEVLRMLGFAKTDLDVKFPPHFCFDKIYVNKIRKVLYRLCDAFDSTDGENLLRLVHTDFQKKGFNFTVYNPEYLELYLLHWESLGYIKQDNLSNLCNILNVMEQLDWCDVLKQLFPAVGTRVSEKTKTSTLFSFQSSQSTQISVDKNANYDTIEKYDVDPKSPGVCLIINQEYFYREIEPDLQRKRSARFLVELAPAPTAQKMQLLNRSQERSG